MRNAVLDKGKTALSRKYNSCSAIVTREVTIYQLLLMCQEKRLTDALELLEKHDITENLAIIVIESLQNLEVAA
jgi:hypothetical protein